MGLIEQLLAGVDNAKRVAKRNVSDLASNPALYAERMTDALRNRNANVVPTASSTELTNRPMTRDEVTSQYVDASMDTLSGGLGTLGKLSKKQLLEKVNKAGKSAFGDRYYPYDDSAVVKDVTADEFVKDLLRTYKDEAYNLDQTWSKSKLSEIDPKEVVKSLSNLTGLEDVLGASMMSHGVGQKGEYILPNKLKDVLKGNITLAGFTETPPQTIWNVAPTTKSFKDIVDEYAKESPFSVVKDVPPLRAALEKAMDSGPLIPVNHYLARGAVEQGVVSPTAALDSVIPDIQEMYDPKYTAAYGHQPVDKTLKRLKGVVSANFNDPEVLGQSTLDKRKTTLGPATKENFQDIVNALRGK